MINDNHITNAEIERRTKIAKMQQLELAVKKDTLALEDKKRNLCRIDLALDEFDKFLKDFVVMMRQLPDFIQSVYPDGTPTQYKTVQDHIDDTIQRLGEKRLHLALESTRDEKDTVNEATYESRKKNARTDKD